MSKTQKGQVEGDMPVRRGQPKKNASGPRHVLSSEFINVGQIPKGKDSRITLPPISSIRVSELRPGPSGEPLFVIKVSAGDKLWLVERFVSEVKQIAEWVTNYHPSSGLPIKLPTWKRSNLPTPADIIDAVDKYLSQFPQFPDIVGSWEMIDMFEVERQFTPPTTPETGLLYLKLIGVRGLVPENKKDELLGATIKVSTCCSIRKRVEGQEAEYQATLTSRPTESNSRDASWLHEMAFTVFDKSRPLWIQVLDKNKKIIAHGQLSTAGTVDGKVSKVKLLLTNVFAPVNAVATKSKTGTSSSTDDPRKSKLFVLAQFTPAQVRQPLSWNIPPIRVQLTHSEYAPGEEVRGVLILNAPESIKAEHVVLTFLGRIKVDTSDMVDQSVQTTFEHSVELFNDSILCWTDRDRQTLPAGFYVWPFRFRLPDRLPPSHATYYGSVEYIVRASLYRSGALTSKKKKVDSELVVLSTPSLYTSVLKPEETPSPLMRRAVFKSGSENVTIKAKLAFSPVLIGTPALIKIIVDNESTRKLSNIVVKLLVNTTYRAPGRSTTVVEEISTSKPLSDEDHIPVDSRQVLKVLLDVPATTQPSLPPQMSSILEAQYLIQIEVGGAAGFNDAGVLRATMPLLVSHNVSAEQTRLKTYRASSKNVVGERTPQSSRRKRAAKKNVETIQAGLTGDESTDDLSADMRSDNPLDSFLPMPDTSEYTTFPQRVPSIIKTPSNSALEIRNATPAATGTKS